MRPFLKWLGGKHKIVPRIAEQLPKVRCLVEPFVGSGAVFLNTDYPFYILADINEDLIGLYQTLQSEGESFIQYCKSFFTDENNCSERYYALRERFNTTDDRVEKSALFVYINRFGFNGLCRYNKRGEINVPFGRYDKPYFPEEEMRFFHEKSKNARFICADFTYILQHIQGNLAVYCDPPYIPISETSDFTSYHTDGFSDADQRRLAYEAKKLRDKEGITVVVSNNDDAMARYLYRHARIVSFDVQRNVSAKVDKREKVKEILAIYQ